MRSTTQFLAIVAVAVAASATIAQPVGFFTDVQPVLADPNFSDFISAVSPDGKTLYFTSANRSATPGNEDIWVATRPDTSAMFGNIQTLGSPINTPEQEDVGYIAPGELTIYFGSNRTGSESFDLYQATRMDPAQPFGTVQSLGMGVNTSFGENGPRLTPDEKTIVFHRSDPANPQRDIWIATRNSANEPFGTATVALATPFQDWFPSISADTLTLFLSDWVTDPPRPGGQGLADIWVSTRASINDSFGPVVNLNDMWPGTQINSQFFDGAPYISPDWPAPGSKLYFGSNSLTGQLVADVFQATWVPEPAAVTMLLIGLLGITAFRRQKPRRKLTH